MCPYNCRSTHGSNQIYLCAQHKTYHMQRNETSKTAYEDLMYIYSYHVEHIV